MSAHASRPRLTLSALLALACACTGPRGEDEATSDELATDDSSGDSSGETDTTATLDLPPEPPPAPEPMVVMTFNVLCSFCDDTYAPWDARVGYAADTILRHAPDLVGLQELFKAEEVEQLLALAPGYQALFYQDEIGAYADATILWRADRYEPLESGFYWLSPTPEVPYSVGFAPPQFARMVAWVRLRETSSGAELLFADTHFDNNSPSQDLSAPLLLDRTAAQGEGLPIVVVGDFNSDPSTSAYATLTAGVEGEGLALTDAFEQARAWSIETNMQPPAAYDPTLRIDHVFMAGGTWAVPEWTVDTWVYGEPAQHTSDHFAIVAQLEFVAP